MTHVLFVEDHDVFRQSLAAVLDREPDLEVVAQAHSLAEARNFGASDVFDVAVVDLRLPDGDGADLIRELLATSPRTSVLVLTAYWDPAELARAREAGAQEVLGKDADLDEIVGAIRRLGAG